MISNNNSTTWNRKKQVYNVNKEDPFAGMNASIDYQKEIERLKEDYIKPKAISRSTSPYSSSSSDSDISEFITEEEKVRFLAFIRSWTGDWQNTDSNYSTNESLWTNPSPWNSPIRNQKLSLKYHPLPSSHVKKNHLLPSPIGMGRKQQKPMYTQQ